MEKGADLRDNSTDRRFYYSSLRFTTRSLILLKPFKAE